MDPFTTMGISPAFAVDLVVVGKTHRRLSQALHPDRHIGASAGQKSLALARTIDVNEAWRILKDPLLRAEALLSLEGGEVAAPDSAFLTEHMEQREALADARRARNGEAVRALGAAIRAQSTEIEDELSCRDPGGSMGATHGMAVAVSKLRFYRRLLDEVLAIEEELLS